jgi:metallo-beta-lactamase class B
MNARSVAVAVILASSLAYGQEQPGSAKLDSPAVRAMVEHAKQTAGRGWAEEANFLCLAPHGNSDTDPLIEPAKIFDNVYAMGRTGTVVYAITTTDGILLIDTGYAKDVEPVLLAGMRKLGLDPARIKTVIIAHGHADHFGGAAYLQEHFAPRIVMSEADWAFMLNSQAAPAAPNAPRLELPRKDVVAMEGQPITLGDTTITPVMIPGHTPGSMALIFPVKDGGTTHMAGLFGGTILISGRISNDGLQQYLRSIQHFKSEAARLKVDVELQNHPVFDGMPEKLAQLKNRRANQPNPFVVSQASYATFLDVMSECMQVAVTRRAEGN